MIYNKPPKDWESGEQIGPEGINRNSLLMRQTLDEWSSFRYRRTNTSTMRNAITLPSLSSNPYVVERIQVFGTYSGDPILNFGTETFALPVNGNKGEFYIGTVLPATLISGIDNVVQYDINFTGGNTDSMRIAFGLRTDRFSTFPAIPDLELYSDEDVLDATTWNAKIAQFQSFANTIAVNEFPREIDYMSYEDMTVANPQTDRVLGAGNVNYSRLVGKIRMDTLGSVGQTVTINYGFGDINTPQFIVVSVQAQTIINFSSGFFSFVKTGRIPTDPESDWKVTITTNGTSTVKSVDLFVTSTR